MNGCFIGGEHEKLRACDSCEMPVCPAHRKVVQPAEMEPLFFCAWCWEYMVRRVGEENLERPVADPDL